MQAKCTKMLRTVSLTSTSFPGSPGPWITISTPMLSSAQHGPRFHQLPPNPCNSSLLLSQKVLTKCLSWKQCSPYTDLLVSVVHANHSCWVHWKQWSHGHDLLLVIKRNALHTSTVQIQWGPEQTPAASRFSGNLKCILFCMGRESPPVLISFLHHLLY